jgi:hypothetical protein
VLKRGPPVDASSALYRSGSGTGISQKASPMLPTMTSGTPSN